MAEFAAECIGGPWDGTTLRLARCPQDGDEVKFTDGYVYRFSWSRGRWEFWRREDKMDFVK